MKSKLAILLFVACLCFSGCKSLTTPAALSADIALAARVGLDVYPQATPGVALARDVICAEAAQTNIQPTQIVADLAAAGITNSQAMIIIDGALLLYEQVLPLIGTNNVAKVQPYLQSFCSGLSQALPPPTLASRIEKHRKLVPPPLPPHLK